MSYTIQIDYQTGSSFQSHREQDCVAMVWNDIKTAKKALNAIKEHHKAIQYCRGDRSELGRIRRQKGPKAHEEALETFYQQIKDKPWFALETNESGKALEEKAIDWEIFLNVPDKQDQSWVPINAFWVGFFERLYKAEIVINKSDDNDELCYEP